MAIASALSAHSAFGLEKVWIDLILFGAFAMLHGIANWTTPGLTNDADNRERAFTFTSTLASGSVTAVGILLPLTLAAIGTFITKGTPSSAVLVNVFVADAWLALSLALCLLVLWTIGFRAHSENVQNMKLVRLANGWQIGALLLGIVRLLIAAFFLVQHPT